MGAPDSQEQQNEGKRDPEPAVRAPAQGRAFSRCSNVPGVWKPLLEEATPEALDPESLQSQEHRCA